MIRRAWADKRRLQHLDPFVGAVNADFHRKFAASENRGLEFDQHRRLGQLPGRNAERTVSHDLEPALDILESKRDGTGRWPMDHAYHDAQIVDFGEAEGQPSRWITLRALRALRWAGRAS